MGERKFNDWLVRLPALTAAQKQRMETALARADPAIGVPRELDALGVSECPHCAAGSPVRYGRVSDLQRSKCHACRRTFNVLTGTPLARLRHRSAWRVFAQALIDGEPVRVLAARAGVYKNTAPLGGIGSWPHPRLCRQNAWRVSSRPTRRSCADRTRARGRSNARPPRKGGGKKKARRGCNSDDEAGVLVLRDRDAIRYLALSTRSMLSLKDGLSVDKSIRNNTLL